MAYIKRERKASHARRTQDESRKGRMKVYMSARWRRLSELKRQEFPLCEICEMQGKVKAGDDVHHLRSFTNLRGNEKEETVHDYSNLITVCKSCHHSLHHGSLRGCLSLEEIRERIGSL